MWQREDSHCHPCSLLDYTQEQAAFSHEAVPSYSHSLPASHIPHPQWPWEHLPAARPLSARRGKGLSGTASSDGCFCCLLGNLGTRRFHNGRREDEPQKAAAPSLSLPSGGINRVETAFPAKTDSSEDVQPQRGPSRCILLGKGPGIAQSPLLLGRFVPPLPAPPSLPN